MPTSDDAGEIVTLATLQQRAAADLESAGVPREVSRGDAEVLLRHALGADTAEWLVRLRDPAPPHLVERLAPLLARRRLREPVAYITGYREFYGRPFRVTPDVLVPRPETELVVAQALDAIAVCRSNGARPLRLADVGTGSGCLAVTTALEAPDVDIVATDVSARALQVAAVNAAALGAGARIHFQHVELVGGAVDAFKVIVSNPPYVAERDRASLMPDVRDYEPAVALYGGPDGLDVIRQLLPAAARALSSGGWLIVEIGSDQAPGVSDLLNAVRGLSLVRVVEDLAGHPRVVVARKSGARTDDCSV